MGLIKQMMLEEQDREDREAQRAEDRKHAVGLADHDRERAEIKAAEDAAMASLGRAVVAVAVAIKDALDAQAEEKALVEGCRGAPEGPMKATNVEGLKAALVKFSD